jgi:hypothetical protein
VLETAEAVRALAILCDQEHAYEVRGLPTGQTAILPGKDAHALALAAQRIAANNNSVYLCLNPVALDCRPEKGVKDFHILHRRWLMIDIDPIKADGFADDPATDEEKGKTCRLATKIRVELDRRGWPQPVIIDSGNGHYLLYRIDLENTEVSRALIKGFLYRLHEWAKQGALGSVDKKTHNASRIAKIPGASSRKVGAIARPDRPFRTSRLLFAPPELGIVTAEQIGSAFQEGTETSVSPLAQESANADRITSPLVALAPGEMTPYGRKALDNILGKISSAIPGGKGGDGRNDQFWKGVVRIAELVAGKEIDGTGLEQQLKDLARSIGLTEGEITSSFAGAWAKGIGQPRAAPDRNKDRNGQAKQAPVDPSEKLIIRASEVVPRKVEWLWPSRIPRGKLTTFAGIGGLGKTFVLLDIAARVSRGSEWPDKSGIAKRGQVLYVSGEDEPEDTLVPRLIEMNADLTRIAFFRPVVLGVFTLRHLPTLDAAIHQIGEGVSFVVIDPPTSYLAGVDDHKNTELRSILSPLALWAAKHDVALVFNTHVNKGSGQKMEAMMRVIGGVTWVNIVRAAHVFARDQDDPALRYFAPMKNNLGPEVKALSYRLHATNDLARVEWLGEVNITADQAINRDKVKSRKIVASEWLIERFREKREWDSDDLFHAAKEHGVSRDAIFEAKAMLDLPRAKKRIGLDGDICWVWHVPDDWDHLTVAEKPSLQ